MADSPAVVAHVLRRLTFGVHPERLAQFAGSEAGAVIDQLLAEPPIEPKPPELGSGDDYSKLPQWWVDMMARPDAGVHERMVWFWHTMVTSSLAKASPALMYRQHTLLRQHALGNFRALMQAVTTDAAMLYWLDGAGNTIESPNENYAREVMELFTLGAGSGYTEADVHAGAAAFAGWWVDGDHDDKVNFDPDNGPKLPIEFLGKQVSSAAEAIDAICDHPACAPHVVDNVYSYLVGQPPTAETRSALAEQFRATSLEIQPLVAAIVRSPDFINHRSNRPRSAVEWFIAFRHLVGAELDWGSLVGLGQEPFGPPNVAGWPGPERWISAGAEFAKAQLAYDNSFDTETLDSYDPVSAVLAKAALFEVSDATRTTLQQAADATDSRRDRSSLLHALVACSPEFSLA
jgi:uncharacterized protein (DUF1800 family)